MKNLFLLETEKPSRIIGSRLGMVIKKIPIGGFEAHRPYHLYTTSDEVPKLNEWGINTKNNVLFTSKGFTPDEYDKENCRKIILTTDPDLIKDGVQAIPDEFLEWFVFKTNDSGKPIDIVEVKKVYINLGKEDIFDLVCTACPFKYEIIIPKEDEYLSPMQKFKRIAKEYVDDKDAYGYDIVNKESIKQETLEEAAERAYLCGLFSTKTAFIVGARWQAEKMYSKEEALIIWKAGQEYWKTSGESITFEELVEQLKK